MKKRRIVVYYLCLVLVVMLVSLTTIGTAETVQVIIEDVDDGTVADLQSDYSGHYGWAQDDGDDPGDWGFSALVPYGVDDMKSGDITLDGDADTWWSHIWVTGSWEHTNPATGEFREYAWPTGFSTHYMENNP
ncbi:hypothetical protein K8I28_08830 [bacterium]|nr:hypothetical protein [bacterium]